MHDLSLWGGHEYTVNRIGEVYFDQTIRSGHERRPEDIELFAQLGVKALRYPLLWERVSPSSPDSADWGWTDQRLKRMRAAGVMPIAGLVHHGAGPHYATLETDAYAGGLADFAHAAAQRYPWIECWTPVNEPLTTARFSALYGHWYPHARDETTFWRVLFNQIDAVRLSMREIRKINASARLVQTEDLGRSYSTAAAAPQAAFDNTRRWMTWDLLCGRVTHDHPLWLRLTRLGFGGRLRAIADDPCPPDIIGINHYLTSDRFLDDRVELYPEASHGGNRYVRFADIEAVRVLQPAPAGLKGALSEAWSRYGIPLAVTEVHNGCTREEQMRWFSEAWDTAREMQAEGVDIRAVTAWSLLGAYDWDSLLTRQTNHYEPGVYDVSSGTPRPTAMASLLQSLSGRQEAPSRWRGDGWWRRDIRLVHQPVRNWSATQPPKRSVRARRGADGPVLIIGATGTLGRMMARTCDWRDLDYVMASRENFCVSDRKAAARFIRASGASAVVNCAGWVKVDEAEGNQEACRLANTDGAIALSRACAESGVPVVTFSTDLVFDGAKAAPYVEGDASNPLNTYGASKREAEEAILKEGSPTLIVRTAAFFSPFDANNFAVAAVKELSAGREFHAASDLVVSPTFVPDLANTALDLLMDREQGIWHLANKGTVSWADFATMIAAEMKLDANLVVPRKAEEFGWAAARPKISALSTQRGAVLPPLDEALRHFASATRCDDQSSGRFASQEWIAAAGA